MGPPEAIIGAFACGATEKGKWTGQIIDVEARPKIDRIELDIRAEPVMQRISR